MYLRWVPLPKSPLCDFQRVNRGAANSVTKRQLPPQNLPTRPLHALSTVHSPTTATATATASHGCHPLPRVPAASAPGHCGRILRHQPPHRRQVRAPRPHRRARRLGRRHQQQLAVPLGARILRQRLRGGRRWDPPFQSHPRRPIPRRALLLAVPGAPRPLREPTPRPAAGLRRGAPGARAPQPRREQLVRPSPAVVGRRVPLACRAEPGPEHALGRIPGVLGQPHRPPGAPTRLQLLRSVAIAGEALRPSRPPRAVHRQLLPQRYHSLFHREAQESRQSGHFEEQLIR